MRSVAFRLAFLLPVLIVAPQLAGAQAEVVAGFRGHAWGTPATAIPEIAGTQPAGDREGLPFYAADVTVQGRKGLAGFYFHPDTGGLIEGAYVFVLDQSDCQAVWVTFARSVEAEYPSLRKEEDVPTREDDVRSVYETDCQYFVYNAHRLTWSTTWVNPGPSGDRVAMWIRVNERTPRLTVVYRGATAQAWVDGTGGNAGR